MNKTICAAGLLFTTVCFSIAANAERPSITSLTQQINELNARVNDLEAQGGPIYVIDGDSNRIGKLANWHDTSTVLTNKHFLFKIGTSYTRSDYGAVLITNMYYEAAGCSGQAYVYFMAAINNVPQGEVINGYGATAGENTLYYIKDSLPRVINKMSHTGPSGCESTAGSLTVYPATPNDPNITGITQSAFPTPITLSD